MSKYRVIVNRDTGRRAAVVEEETPKFKVLTVHFLDDDSEQQYSSSTIKRYWKKTEEFAEVEDKAGDGTPYKQIMKEILQDEKKATAKKEASKYVDAGKKITKELNKNNSKSLQEMVDVQAKKPKKEKKSKRATFDSTALQEYAIKVLNSLGGDYVQRKQDNGAKDMAQKAFRAGGKMFMHMCYPRYNLYFNTRGVDTDTFVPDAELTGFYSVRYIFNEDTKETRAKIKQLITQAYKAQLAKNNKKGKGDK